MRSLLLLSLLLAVPTACNQSLTPDMTGMGGTGAGTGGGDGGSGPGTGGVRGLGGSIGPAACAVLVAEYQSALTAAEACQVGASGQCQQIVSGSPLGGCSCPVHVTDSSTLSMIEEAWRAGGCVVPTASCEIGCPVVITLNTTCVPTDGGTVGFCSYVPGTGGTSGAGGTGGSGATGGTTGGTGSGGSAVDGGLNGCSTLASEYAAVLIGAKSCTAGAAGQCGKEVPSALSPCQSGCAELVTDSSVLDSIQQKWEAAGCADVAIACPLIACAPPTSAACLPSDAGGSVCSTGYGTFMAN